MKALRGYLLAFSNSGCDSSVHRDMESLLGAWKPYVGREDVCGVVHIGFGRPETESFQTYVSSFMGKVLLTGSARWALVGVTECAQKQIGEVDFIPVYVALNGWGYSLTTEEIFPEQAVLESCKTESTAPSAPSAYPLEKAVGGQAESFEMKENESIAHSVINSIPNALLNTPLTHLQLQNRTFNALAAKGFKLVGDLGSQTSEMLLDFPNFGQKSLSDLSEKLQLLAQRCDLPKEHRPGDFVATEIEDTNATSIVSRFANFDSLPAAIRSAVSSLSSDIGIVVRARMGLDTESATLQELGDSMNPPVSRERIRQKEAKGVAQIAADSIWADCLESRLAHILDTRDDPLPLSGLQVIDTWFSGIEKIEDAFRYLLENRAILGRRFSLIQANGQTFVSRLTQNDWDSTLKIAMKLLEEEGIEHKWTKSKARTKLDELLMASGRELRPELWTAATRFAHFSSENSGNAILISYGRSAESLVEAALFDSNRPLHYSEIPQLVLNKFGKAIAVRRAASAASKVGLLFGSGSYGLLKHCPLDVYEREQIREETESILSAGEKYRQWSCAELVDELSQRGMDFDERLTPYTLNISLNESSELQYLGRNLWGRRGDGAGSTSLRIDIRQAITALLTQAGKPMTNSEIKDALSSTRGVNKSFQVFPSGSIINVGLGLWGLIERDLPISPEEQHRLVDILKAILLKNNIGLHSSEILDNINAEIKTDPASDSISKIHDPEMVMAIAVRSGSISKSSDGYLYLSEWGEHRRIKKTEAVFSILKEVGNKGVSAGELTHKTSVKIGREIARASIYSSLTLVGAIFDESKKLWILPVDVEESISSLD